MTAVLIIVGVASASLLMVGLCMWLAERLNGY